MIRQIKPISIPNISVHETATEINEMSHFAEIPLSALGANTRRILSELLNRKKIFRSEEGHDRDWRGVALLAQVLSLCNENSDDPMTTVLKAWCQVNPKTATFANLEKFLGIIDRWDVSDDIYENLVSDAKKYSKSLRKNSTNDSDLVLQNVNTTDCDFSPDCTLIMTDDVMRAQKGLPLQHYDAFVLFAEPDIEYAIEIRNKFEENSNYNIKLCFKDHVLAGVQSTETLMQLIEERCNHLLVILTKDFIKSPENKFLVTYTHTIQIQENKRKIVPLIYDRTVEIPRSLKIYTRLYYHATSGLYDFWDRLANSICDVNAYSRKLFSPPTLSALHTATPDTLSTLSLPNSLPSVPSNPSLTTTIPSININGQAYIQSNEELLKKKKEGFKFNKRSSLRQSNNKDEKPIIPKNVCTLRNAHSTNQLSSGYNDTNMSMPDLHTETDTTKKKKKRPIRTWVREKLFNRSKLQEAE